MIVFFITNLMLTNKKCIDEIHTIEEIHTLQSTVRFIELITRSWNTYIHCMSAK